MLYTDCLVHHPISFFTSPDVHLAQSNKRPQLSSIKTLRLGHSSSPVEPPYRDLMHQEDATGAAWGMGGSSRYPHDIMRSPQQELNKLVVDGRYLFSIADWLQRTSERGEDMLPSVERIVLMGRVDDATSSRAIKVLSKGLADVLIRNPSVKHFCQSSILGPLAMSGALYKPLHTPVTVTYHIGQSPYIWQWGETIPVVLGTTNRYICANPVKFATLSSSKTSDIDDQWLGPLNPLIRMLTLDNKIVRERAKNVLEEVPLESALLEGTTVELYNLVSDMVMAPLPPAQLAEHRRLGTWATPDLKPLTLEVRQALAKRLDARIGPWKGRVVFRNADEIPLCPACQIPDTIRVGFE